MLHTSLGCALTSAAAQFDAAMRRGHITKAAEIADRADPLLRLSEKLDGQPAPLAMVEILSAEQIMRRHSLTRGDFDRMVDEVLRAKVSRRSCSGTTKTRTPKS